MGVRRIDRPHSSAGNYGKNDYFPSFHAMTHRVCILPVPNFQLLDMAGPLSVFQIAAELVPEIGRAHV